MLRSPHLSLGQKAAALLELTSQPTSYIVLWYVIMSLTIACFMPGMAIHIQYRWLIIIAAFHSIATLSLLIHALSPFLTSLLPWRFGLSLGCIVFYLPWKLLVLAQGRPDRWIRTDRESH